MSRSIPRSASRAEPHLSVPRQGRVWARGSLRLAAPEGEDGIRIAALVAHENPHSRNAIAAGLVQRGFDTVPCQDGCDVLHQLSARRFDLVVTGMAMPEMDGLELIMTLKRRVPVIAVVDRLDPLGSTYRRGATLLGAASTHVLPQDMAGLFESADWLVRGRLDVIKKVVW